MAIRASSLAGPSIPVGGPAGLPGQSTYAAWLALGNVGSLADFVAAQKSTNGASTVSALTDATPGFKALNTDAAGQRQAMGAAGAGDLLGIAQDTLTALGGKLDALLTGITLTVGPAPSSYPTVQAALASLDGQFVGRTGLVTIQLAAGFIDHAATVLSDRPDAARIVIQGQTPGTTPLTGISGVTGSAGAWSVTASFGSIAGMLVGGIVQLTGTAGASPLHDLHRGAWRVAAITDGTTAVLTSTVYNLTPPTGAITGTATVYKSHLRFATGVNAFDVAALGGITNVAVLGQFANDNTIGLWSKSTKNCGQGRAILGPNLAVCGFGAEGVRSNYVGGIDATGVVSSSNGNNGFMGRDQGQMALFGCLASGNGTYLPAGGGNGLLSQNTSSVYAVSFEAYGNAGYGQFARSGGTILNQTGQSARAVGNVRGFATLWGFLQDEGAIAAWNIIDFHNDNGRMIITAGSSTSAQVNAVVTINGGQTDANGGFTITAPTFNGFVASAAGRIDAANANVVSVGAGSAPYYEGPGGTIVSTGAVGLAGRYSAEAGRVLQTQSASPYTANANFTAAIPLDDTIPQITEGTQILSVPITPVSTTSKVRLRFVMDGTMASAGTLIVAIFRVGQSDAIRARAVSIVANNGIQVIALEVDDAPATTAAVTYTVRIGPDSGTARLNGTGIGRLFGGSGAATLVAEEIKG
ncbi:hypothetical protein [Methylobacterium sp. E-046]|uniref:hypothetical protein n=1 Tax=Methylobacterium sp. E-046 TaxID=2836576 RepID=UPI001FBA5BD5|nr:hypothetical protein [Methylobacterium sp. E-046]MCJ2102468.1 hypothetical protein [Methylobacterium sp. E-046]